MGKHDLKAHKIQVDVLDNKNNALPAIEVRKKLRGAEIFENSDPSDYAQIYDLQTVVAGVEIDDTTISLTKTWSSKKISDEDANEALLRQAADEVLSDDIDLVEANLTSHTNNTSNPHNVTKAQVGLSNVDNTSDMDKPVSTAQGLALNSKEDVSNKVNNLSSPDDVKYPSTKAVADALALKLSASDIGNYQVLKTVYVAAGGETSLTKEVLGVDLTGRYIISFNRTQDYQVIGYGSPGNQQVLFNTTTGRFDFQSSYPLNAGEKIFIESQTGSPTVQLANVINIEYPTYAAMIAALPSLSTTIRIEIAIVADEVNAGGAVGHYTYNRGLLTTFIETEA